jgi:hypothetical protein
MSEFKKEARTLFASKAMELSDMFAVKFGTRAFDGNPRRMVKLQPPAESTGGGAQARESIVLLPVGTEGFAGALMCGWADVASKAAELRTFRSLSGMYKARNKAPLQMDEAQYNAFVAESQTFFQQEGFAVNVNDSGPPAGASSRSDMPARQSGGGGNMGMFIAFAVVAIGLGLGLGWFLFGRGG